MFTHEFIGLLRDRYTELLPTANVLYQKRYLLLKELRTAQSIDKALGIYYAAIKDSDAIEKELHCRFLQTFTDPEIHLIYSDILSTSFKTTFSTMPDLDDDGYNSFYNDIDNAKLLLLPKILDYVRKKSATYEMSLPDIHLELLVEILNEIARSEWFRGSEKNFFLEFEKHLTQQLADIQERFNALAFNFQQSAQPRYNLKKLGTKSIRDLYLLVRRESDISLRIMPIWQAAPTEDCEMMPTIESNIETTIPNSCVNLFKENLFTYSLSNDLLENDAKAFVGKWIKKLRQHATEIAGMNSLNIERKADLRNTNVLLHIEFMIDLQECAQKYANNHLFAFVTEYKNGVWRQSEGLVSGMESVLYSLKDRFEDKVCADEKLYKIFALPRSVPSNAPSPSPSPSIGI